MHRNRAPSSASTLLLASLALLPVVVAAVSSSNGGGSGSPDLCSEGGLLDGSLTPQGIRFATRAAGGGIAGPTGKMGSSEGWRALVTGGTGAIGRYLVAELLGSDKFSAVTVIGRREISFPSDKQPTSDQLEKLRYEKVNDLADIASLEPSQLTPSQYEVAFCALGTTRKDAGSAAAFRKVDYDGVVNFGNLAKKAEVQHLQLVSSMGANKNSFFLYPKTKGESEDFYQSLGVRQTTIFRPPLLNRGESSRTVEKIALYVMPSAKVGDVAKAMVKQAETVLESNKEGEEILNWNAMKQLI